MTFNIDTAPDPVTAPAAMFGTWQVGTPQRQQATAEAIADAWRKRPWPGPGLQSYTVLAADDGTTLLHFSQVNDLDEVPPQDLTWKQEVDAAVPDIERTGVIAAKRRESTPAYGPAAEAGCVVLVTRLFDGPDTGRANRPADAMFGRTIGTPPPDGLLSAHFYVNTDGTRVFSYALWTTTEAHRQAIEHRPARPEAHTQRQQAPARPGLLDTTVQRFRPALQLTSRI
ncbi:antibiotic biosynthesis monooxygenase [Streptomyces iconiensis]|uniref:Antibiotic biosynthesis monooxygenase n=1 Tax=Streptomyces iconiensis TaxID=1384038 RepID=A0ABT7A6D2_9ACTN|nr:antibiotic biosynthesis monooxygenase [Streptomyces iconiensis]MDJ1136866.1 antibiotic biosynthesis monooxygenase [Streptomyces iconiensis]